MQITALVADRKIDSAHPRAGHGLPEDVDVVLNGSTPAAVTLQQIDVNNVAADRTGNGHFAGPVADFAPLPGLRARAADDHTSVSAQNARKPIPKTWTMVWRRRLEAQARCRDAGRS